MHKTGRQEDVEYVYEELNVPPGHIEMSKQEEKEDVEYVYEELNKPQGTSTSLVKFEDEVYSYPHFQQPLPDLPLPVTPPNGGDVREEEEESDYI